MIDSGLQGKVALITGANHGIGAATALALAAQGVRVFITYLRLSENDEVLPAAYRNELAKDEAETVTRIRQGGGEAAGWEGDLGDAANIPTLFDRAEAAFGPVNILVNNATHWQADSFPPTDDAARAWPPQSPSVTASSIDRHFQVNSRAVALMMAEFARRHIASGAHWGRIINLSTEAESGFPGEVSYGASKAAIESYSRSAAAELGKYGITVNIVAPGPTQTGWISPELEQQLAARNPLGRVGQPEDVADVIVFLASEQGRWLTGQKLHAGGGHRMLAPLYHQRRQRNPR